MQRAIGKPVVATASLAVLATVAACGGGGGGGGGQSNVPGTPVKSQAAFTITVPAGAGTSSTQRRPAFVSPNTQSITIALAGTTATAAAPTTANLTPASPGCTAATAGAPLTCTVFVAAPAGNDSFTLTTYAGLNGSGTVLSTATVTALISATQATTVPVTLGGVVASIVVSVTNGNNVVPGGYATSLPVVVTAKDPSGAAIVGPGNYTNPITLTDADTSGVTTLSTTTVTSPSTVVTLAYAPTDTNSGVLDVSGLPVGATTIGAAATGVPASAVTAGTFQYIADRFFGFGHTRSLDGGATVATTSYNGTGVATGTTTTVFSITDHTTNHSAASVVATFGTALAGPNAVQTHHVVTYTQTSPITAVPPEVFTRDDFRQVVFTPASAILDLAAQNENDVNSGAGNSLITGYLPGTTNDNYAYAASPGWQVDALPHSTTAWSNSAEPFTETYTGAEVATFQHDVDGSVAFNETSPNTVNKMQTAAGAATNFQSTTGITTTISLPSGGLIPMAQETTSPLTPPVTSFNDPDWYPGGAAPLQPLYSYQFAETQTAIPAPCDVPAAIATQAYAIVQTNTVLDIASFESRQNIYSDYYVPGGVGWVCEVFAGTISDYRFSTGIIFSSTVVSEVYAVTNASNL